MYAPTTDTQQGFFAGGAEAGLRIQKPVSGPFVDISAGGYGGFEAQLDKPIEGTGGFTGAVGVGWRWQRIEVGPEARGLVPFTSDDPKRVLVVGKVTARLGSRIAQPLERVREASIHLGGAEQRQHFEQPGTYRFSRHGYTYGVNQRTGFHLSRISGRAESRFCGGRVERR